jgi:hypothetical protein
MGPKEIGVNMWNWINLAHDRDHLRALVNVALNFWVLLAMQLVIFCLSSFII